ncbi:MAG: tetratricopeptide repeat protein [Vulcanimicrobiota bacterium]
MSFILFYKDKEKQKLQKIEIVLVLLLLPFGLWGASRGYQEWKLYQQADTLFMEAHQAVHDGKDGVAIEKLKKCVEIYPAYYAAWEEWATAVHFAGDHEGEVAIYQRAVEANPDNDLLKRDLGAAYHEVGMHDRELAILKTAADTLVEDPFAQRLLARAEKEASGEAAPDVPLEKEGHIH